MGAGRFLIGSDRNNGSYRNAPATNHAPGQFRQLDLRVSSKPRLLGSFGRTGPRFELIHIATTRIFGTNSHVFLVLG